MRIRTVAVLSTLLAIALLAPTSAWAARITASGSLTVGLTTPGVLTNQLVVAALTIEQEFLTPTEVVETSVTMPLPGAIFTVPFIVNKETTGPVLEDLDTVLFIVNTTGLAQFPVIILQRLDGTLLRTFVINGGIAPNATMIIRISTVLSLLQ